MTSQPTPESQPAKVESKFPRDKRFDARFDEVKDLIWYPYVGKRFGENGVRVMVYGHNAYLNAQDYEKTKKKWVSDKAEWANCIEEYTYEHGWYTKAFRYFIKGAVGLKSDFFGYGERISDPSILERVDSFIEQIAWINFIQDAVKSDKALAYVEPEQIERSIKINREILKILNVTHCICWGKPTYEYVCSRSSFNILSEKHEGKRGFSSCVIDVGGGKTMRCLKTYHPSMPGFGPFSDATFSIISGFLNAPFTEVAPQPQPISIQP